MPDWPNGREQYGPGMSQPAFPIEPRSEEHTSELQSRQYLVCRLLLEKQKMTEHAADERALGTPHARLRSRARAATHDHRPVPVSPTCLAVLRRLAAPPVRGVKSEELA